MSEGLVQAAYIIAALLFIMSLAGLSKHETAKAGCWYGIVGMTIALVATIFGPQSEGSQQVQAFQSFQLLMHVEHQSRHR